MNQESIYSDIAKRTGGEIYIGVVGPVRTGKSTLIGRFLDCAVLPNIEGEYDRKRTVDEMPQSGNGKTVTTTEPKFIPDEAVTVRLADGTEAKIRLIDCVGYMVEGALGGEEDGAMRKVTTPWSDDPIPFAEAAEIGTDKVIRDHATIGLLVTADGSFTGIPRENYIEAEERVAEELHAINKPFAIVLNTSAPQSEEAKALAASLEEKYAAPVALVSCPDLEEADIRGILGLILSRFPVRELTFKTPAWMDALPRDHELRKEQNARVSAVADAITCLGDIESAANAVDGVSLLRIDAGSGSAEFDLPASKEIFYGTLSELAGEEIADETDLVGKIAEMANAKREYEKIETALNDAKEKGYGIVMPAQEEIELDEPKLIRQAGGYGVRVTAHGQSIHMIRTGIKAEYAPVVGSEEQTEEVMKYLLSEYEDDPKKLWNSNMFGKSLSDLVGDGMQAKLTHMPEESREKLGQTLERIVNEGAGGLICILL